jgi:uncharacterized protein (TIGR02231 family)
MEAMDEPAAIVAAAPAMTVDWQGATVTYSYPRPVTIRDGAEELRLHLDQITLPAEVYVLAVPLNETTGYVTAEVTNATPEPLLPGNARFYRDVALVGGADIDLIAAGDKAELGFGPLDSLLLTRTVPERSEGDRGVFTASTERSESAMITVENLTPRAWPIRLRDRVPYSEQEELAISYTATPPETARDMEGERGLLEWRFDLAAGAKTEIRLDHVITWPEGMVLE